MKAVFVCLKNLQACEMLGEKSKLITPVLWWHCGTQVWWSNYIFSNL